MTILKKIYPEITIIGIILVGTLCYPLIARGLEYAPPFLFAALRVLIAGISTLLILPIFHQPLLPPKGTWKWVLLFSLLAVGIAYGTMFLSHEGTGTASVAVLENLQPFLAVILAMIFLREKLSPATRTVLLFGTVGVVLMSVPVFAGTQIFVISRAALALLASFSAAMASILAKRIKRPDAIVTISAWQFIVGSIPLFIVSKFSGETWSWHLGQSFWLLLLFLAVVGTAATSAVWYVLVQKTDVSRLSVLFFLAPAFALLLTNRLYSVAIQGWEFVGITAILAGVVIGFTKQIKAKPPFVINNQPI